MRRIALLGSDPELVARMRTLLSGMADIVEIDPNDPHQLKIVVNNGVVNFEGDTADYTFEEIEAMKKDYDDRMALQKARVLLCGDPFGPPVFPEDCRETDWHCDDREYNLSQVNMMRRRDQHTATVKWQHVRPVKARKARRNSVRGRR